MKMALRRPTAALVAAARDQFDGENERVERALKLLFERYPGNTDRHQVLIKVVVLNRLYSTQIFAVMDVADHIYENAQEIDEALAAGSQSIVEKIARVTIKSNGRERRNLSFATKYCSWHNEALFPIWDSRVDTYLWKLQKQDHFSPSWTKEDLQKDYPKFCEVMQAFRDFYDLGSFSFKDADKFLWSEGETLRSSLARTN